MKRLVYVGAIDVRDRSKGMLEYYNEESGESRYRHWGLIMEEVRA